MSDRHEKWVPIRPGRVIEAGEPFRVEYPSGPALELDRTAELVVPDDERRYFVDSSWRPPLVLPTELTLGILRTKHPAHMGSIAYWFHDTQTDQVEGRRPSGLAFVRHNRDYVTDFIPLTDEQVARIEQAR